MGVCVVVDRFPNVSLLPSAVFFSSDLFVRVCVCVCLCVRTLDDPRRALGLLILYSSSTLFIFAAYGER